MTCLCWLYAYALVWHCEGRSELLMLIPRYKLITSHLVPVMMPMPSALCSQHSICVKLNCSSAGQKQLSLIKQAVMSAEHVNVISAAAAASRICTLQVLACLTN